MFDLQRAADLRGVFNASFFFLKKRPGAVRASLGDLERAAENGNEHTCWHSCCLSYKHTHTHTHTHTHPDSQSCMCTCLHMYACMVSPPIVRQVYLFFFTPSIYLKIIALFFFISFLCQGAFTPVCWLVGQLVIFVYLFIIHFCLFLREQLINGYT